LSYRELNNQVIDQLRKTGLWYPYDARLPLFWLRLTVPELAQGLDTLVKLRVEGKENYI
jgi:hypothetical protein